MALALDSQIPLQENLGSFDCEDANSSRQHPQRKKLAGKLAQTIFLSFGIILFMAFVGTPGMLDPNALRNFAIHKLSPPRPSATAQRITHQGQTITIDRPDPPAQIQKPIGHQTVQPLPGGAEQGLTPVAPAAVAHLPGVVPHRRAPTLTMLAQSTEQVCMLMTIIGLGKLLQNRFPNKEPDVIQRLLLQFIFPASLFAGLSSLTLQFSQLGYVAAGVGLVLARLGCGWVAARVLFSGSKNEDQITMRRTAAFQFSTSSYALSVMPFVSEFVGGSFVGLGSLVDLSMKIYMLLVLPVVLEMCGTGSSASGSRGGLGNTIKKLLSDPITLSLILGLAAAAATGGGGCAAMGFVGKAIKNLAGAQTAVLFLLLGLKLKLDSDSPLFSLILFCGVQGALLIVASLICYAIPMSSAMQQFICFFSQGAPSIVGLGVITAAATAGVKGYSTDFGFDIIALACPLSALLQCFGGIMGDAFPRFAGFLGAGLIGVAGLLRVVFRKKFKEEGDGGEKLAAVA